MKRILITALIVLGGVSLIQTIPSASGNLRYGDHQLQQIQRQYSLYDDLPVHLREKYRPKLQFRGVEDDRKSWWGRPYGDAYLGYYKDSLDFENKLETWTLHMNDARGQILDQSYSGYIINNRSTMILPTTWVDGLRFMADVAWLNVVSPDGNFRAWLDFHSTETVADSAEKRFIPASFGKNINPIPRNYMHMYSAWADLRMSHGTVHFDLDSAVRYLTHKEARRMFNADTVITYPFNMKQFKPRGRFLDKYTHLQIYIVQRNERGFLALYCFTTDKGQRDFKKHFRALQKIFRYED